MAISEINGYMVGMLYCHPQEKENIYMLTRILHAGRKRYDLIFRSVFDLSNVVSFRLDYENITGSIPFVINHFQVGDKFISNSEIYTVTGFRPLKGHLRNKRKLVKLQSGKLTSQEELKTFLNYYTLLYE